MASPPSSAIAGAAVAAIALSGVVDTLARTLPLPAEAARAGASAARAVARVNAPRLITLTQAAGIASGLVSTVQALARAAAPADAAAGLYAAARATRACAPSSASPSLTRAYGLARSMCAGLELACLGEAFLAEARSEFGDRQAASAARDRITGAADEAMDRIAAALGQPAAYLLTTAAGQTCAHLADLLGSLQPLVRVEAARSVPSTAAAYSIYADPARAPELVARNRVATPFFMPAAFEAVAPKPGT